MSTEVRVQVLLRSCRSEGAHLRRIVILVRRLMGRVPVTRGLLKVGNIKVEAISKFLTRMNSVDHFDGPGRLRGLTKLTLIRGDSKGRGNRAAVDEQNQGELECLLFRITVSLMTGGPRFERLRGCCAAEGLGPLGGVRSLVTITTGLVHSFCTVLAGNITCSPRGLIDSVEEPTTCLRMTWRGDGCDENYRLNDR